MLTGELSRFWTNLRKISPVVMIEETEDEQPHHSVGLAFESRLIQRNLIDRRK